MRKAPKGRVSNLPPVLMAATAKEPIETAFGEVVGLILAARWRAAQLVNTEVTDLYWRIGR